MSRENAVEEIEPEDRGSRRANPIDVHVGSRVRLRRMLLGMSQEKLGEHLGSDVPTDPKIRKGHQPDRRQPSVRSFAKSWPCLCSSSTRSCPWPAATAAAGFAERPAESYAVEFLGSREGWSSTRLSPALRIRACAARSSSSCAPSPETAKRRSRNMALLWPQAVPLLLVQGAPSRTGVRARRPVRWP